MDKQKPQTTPPPIDATRRRLTQAGLAGPVVLATLASKNVLASTPYNCTISGQLSGNVSSHGTPVNCNTLGLSPGYWRQPQHSGDWTPYIQGSGMVDGSFKPIKCPTLNGSKQSTEGTLFTTAGFANVFKCVSSSSGVTILVYGDPGFPASGNATLEQVVSYGGNAGGLVSLGRAAVGSLLNALRFAPNYPLTPNEVVQMFNAVCMGGTYQVNPTTSWNSDQVKAYFESLY
jgi:hypothetical protein